MGGFEISILRIVSKPSSNFARLHRPIGRTHTRPNILVFGWARHLTILTDSSPSESVRGSSACADEISRVDTRTKVLARWERDRRDR
jgi:hypothetical protein